MKTIKIFLASSDELKEDRIAFGDLIRRLDSIYRKQGTTIELIEWEDLDISYNNCRKQDEYNDSIRQSDVFVALFHTLAGKYTQEEFEVAREENRKRKIPKILIHCRDLQPGEIESKELTEFKERLNNELGHFWGHYNSNDKLHLDFVLWLQNTEFIGNESLQIENNEVTIEGVPIAQISNLSFVVDNKKYIEKNAQIESLTAEVQQLRQAVAQAPSITALQDLLQQKLNELNKNKTELGQLQSLLLDTAKHISDIQLEKVGKTMAHAIKLFDTGDLDGANALLNEISLNSESHIEQFEQDRTLIHQDIEAFRLQAKALIADVNIPVDGRITQVRCIYAKADDWAQRSGYDNKKYLDLLIEYEFFLRGFAKFNDAKVILQRSLDLSINIYGKQSAETANCYNEFGFVYSSLGKHELALEFYKKALALDVEINGLEHPSTATAYNNIGFIYSSLGSYDQAIENTAKALEIRLKIYGEEHPSTAISYNDIGFSYCSLGDYKKALAYHNKALDIRLKVLNDNHPSVATSFNNIGKVYIELGQHQKALDYFNKALVIRQEQLGEKHPYTATSYNYIGDVYYMINDYNKAIEYYNKALDIRLKAFGENHLYVATTLFNMGRCFKELGDYKQAIHNFRKSLETRQQLLEPNHDQINTTRFYIETTEKLMNND